LGKSSNQFALPTGRKRNHFEVEPQPRPEWLGDLPARCLGDSSDLEAAGLQIISANTATGEDLVFLGTPLPSTTAEFGALTLSAFFVSDNFVPAESQTFSVSAERSYPDDFGFNTTREPVEAKSVPDRSGSAISVCSEAQPPYHGFWHDDYYVRGLLLPASYCFEETISQRADALGLGLFLGAEQVAKTAFWHDAWTPLTAPDCPTRCGIIATMSRERLRAAAARFGMKIGWAVNLTYLTSDSRIGDMTATRRTAFIR
jgi:hypothetical protein